MLADKPSVRAAQTQVVDGVMIIENRQAVNSAAK